MPRLGMFFFLRTGTAVPSPPLFYSRGASAFHWIQECQAYVLHTSTS